VAVQVGKARFTLVNVDLLEVPASLIDRLRPHLDGEEGTLWVCPTHAHSSVGGYDPNPVAEISGTGWYRKEIEAAVVDALARAIQAAWKAPAPATIHVDEAALKGTTNRWGDELPLDRRLLVARFDAPDGKVIAEVIRAAGHPTLASRHAALLDGDWPARLAATRERDGRVSLLVQGAGGDASVDREIASTPEAFAALVAAQIPAGDGGVEAVSLAVDGVEVTLPPVELGIAPPWLRRAASNGVDGFAPASAMVGALSLGPWHLVAIPAEVTGAAGRELEGKGDAWSVVTPCNGYIGYVETPQTMAEGGGESQRTNFGPHLLEVLEAGTRAATGALESP
jgi:hypothetical protein